MAGVVKFKLFWEHTIEGYQGTTTMEGSDTKILTERFRKMYPNHRIITTVKTSDQAPVGLVAGLHGSDDHSV